MILPNNGKVVVFDDKVEDVEDLLSSLSKEKIPYLYYKDELATDLPDTPIENVRLIFLDLELVINSPTPKNLIAPIAQRLISVLHKNNPYILIYWSTKEGKYKDLLQAEFEDGLKDYKPIKILSLNKAEAKEKGVSYIKDALISGMKEFSSLNTFMSWESSVNISAGNITNTITSIFEKDDKWDKNIYGLLYKLAVAQAGKPFIDTANNSERLKSAFEIFNTNLTETIEKKFPDIIKDMPLEDIKENGTGMSAENIVKINTKLHLIASSSLQHFYQGNLYLRDINAIGREIIERNFKATKIPELTAVSTKSVCLDITPSCDYSQNKNYTRILYGVLFDGRFKNDLKGGDYKYLCPLMEFTESSHILFDFRCLRSYSGLEFKHTFKSPPAFRLRNSLLLDIQSQLSNHINRPGIVTV